MNYIYFIQKIYFDKFLEIKEKKFNIKMKYNFIKYKLLNKN